MVTHVPFRPRSDLMHVPVITVHRGDTVTEPDTTRAILMCADCEKPAPHAFVGIRPVISGIGEHVFDDLIYACVVCENHRVWGNA